MESSCVTKILLLWPSIYRMLDWHRFILSQLPYSTMPDQLLWLEEVCRPTNPCSSLQARPMLTLTVVWFEE